MVKPVETLPPKLPEGVSMDSPLAHLPLTRENMRTNLDKVLRQMHSYGLTDQQDYEHLTSQLYTPNAQFHYPIAKLNSRYEIVQFWNLFLLFRAFQRSDVYAMNVDVAWDPEKLQALVQIESWYHPLPLAWVDKLLQMPGWKVWSCQVFQFEDSPADGAGALRVTFQEELADQFVYYGIWPSGLYTIRTDPGTPLNWLLNTARGVMGQAIVLGAPLVVQALQALGWVKGPKND